MLLCLTCDNALLNKSDFILRQYISAVGLFCGLISQGSFNRLSGMSLHFSDVFHLFAKGTTDFSTSSSGVRKSSFWLLLNVPQRPWNQNTWKRLRLVRLQNCRYLRVPFKRSWNVNVRTSESIPPNFHTIRKLSYKLVMAKQKTRKVLQNTL